MVVESVGLGLLCWTFFPFLRVAILIVANENYSKMRKAAKDSLRFAYSWGLRLLIKLLSSLSLRHW
jgi:hypothetical protein